MFLWSISWIKTVNIVFISPWRRGCHSTTSGAPIKDECTEFSLKLTQRFFRIFFKDVIVYYYYFAIYSFPPRDGCTGLQTYVKLTHFQIILQIHTNLKISIHLSYEEYMPLRFEKKMNFFPTE